MVSLDAVLLCLRWASVDSVAGRWLTSPELVPLAGRARAAAPRAVPLAERAAGVVDRPAAIMLRVSKKGVVVFLVELMGLT